jgi:hypothetical protein
MLTVEFVADWVETNYDVYNLDSDVVILAVALQ